VTGKPEPVVIDGSDGVWVRPRSFEVTIWPEEMQDEINAGTWCLTVAYRGGNLWGVFRGAGSGNVCLGRDGTWSFGRPDDAGDPGAWVRNYRFTMAGALSLAREWAPKMRTNFMTAAEALERDRA
jgi:hypothetical protein